MSWFRRRRSTSETPAARTDGPAMAIDMSAVGHHFGDFVATRRGVEAYVEPATSVTSTTVVLIAHDGEWTRRAVPGREAAFNVGRSFGIPVYDVNLVGYPARMREYNARLERERRQQHR